MSKFDRTIKEIVQNIFLRSSLSWLGIDLSTAQFEELNPKITRVIDREADFLKKVIHPDLATFILHLEFQTQDDKKMHFRMAEYRALLQRSYELPVRQYVIYLGHRQSHMIAELPGSFQILGYELIELNRFSTEKILSSKIPDEIILAILSDYPRKDAKELVKKMIVRLKSLKLDPEELQRVIYRLLTLSQLRTLERTIKQQVQYMPITIDITKSEIYQEGKQFGFVEAKKQDIQGFLRLGKFNEQDIADATGVTLEYVLEIKKEMQD